MENRKSRFSWGKGDVEITMPNGKKMPTKKSTANKTKTAKKK